MALPDNVKWATPTSRTTGIAAQAVAAGTNYLGSAIANGTNLDRWADIEVAWTEGATPPTAGAALKIAILYAHDGTNHEAGAGDGSNGANDVDPASACVIAACIARGVAGTYRRMISLPIAPKPFKLLLVSELSQSVTCTVLCSTHNEAITD